MDLYSVAEDYIMDNRDYSENLRNTITKCYPIYLKKHLLKMAIKEGLVVDSKKNDTQLTFCLEGMGIVNVSDDKNFESKMEHILNDDGVLKYIAEYEYKRQYRQFCYFKCTDLSPNIFDELIKNNTINLFDKKGKLIDSYDKPTFYMSDNSMYLKFVTPLHNDVNETVNFTVICVMDVENNIIELRFDQVGIAYKNSYDFYKDQINVILTFLMRNLKIEINNIDFKSVVDYMKSEKENVSIFAQKMNRNGTTAYLEAYDEDGNFVMPILGELEEFITQNKDLFNIDENTKTIRKKLEAFIKEIEIKSDMPKVKLRLDEKNIKLGITHNYKNTDYSLFIYCGDLLIDKEMMDYVRNYLIGCSRELERKISS